MLAHARGGGSGRYLLGRLVSYALLGAFAGSVGKALTSLPFVRWVEASFSWLLALMLALAALKLVRRRASAEAPLTLGKEPKRNIIGGVLARLADEPLLLGAATALLPCGALFAAVVAAAALESAPFGALALATFATLSGFALVGAGQLARFFSPGRIGRRVLSVALFAGALVMALRPVGALRATHQPPSCHGPLEER